MIIRISLGLIASAFLALLINKLLLWQAIPLLPELVTRLGIALLLAGFGVLLVSGLWRLGQWVYCALGDYFSAPQRHLRRLLFAANYQEALKQRFYFQKLKIAISNEAKRQQLLKADNHRHINALAKNIRRDLLALKPTLPKAAHQQLRQDLKRYHQRMDEAALLALQQQLATLGMP